MHSPLATLLLLSSFSLAIQAACVDDITLQIFQDFNILASAYCILFKEGETLGYVPSFAEPWGNYPASISSACSCLSTTSFRTNTAKSTSTSKCLATATTVTVTASASTVISTRTVLSTFTPTASTVTAISQITVTATSQFLVPTTLTDYSTLVNTVTNTKVSSVFNTITDIDISTLIDSVTEIDYSTVVSDLIDTESLTNTVTVTSLTESFITTTVVGSASTTSGSSLASSSPSSSSPTSTSVSSTTGSGVVSSSSTSSSIVSSSSTTSSSISSSSSSVSANVCTATAYSQIAPAVAACTQITLLNIAVPDGDSINLASLKAGSVVTFAGTTTFGFTNSSTYNPITLGGAGVTIQGAPGSIIDGNGQAYWDGQGSNGGVPKPDHFIVVNKLTANSVIKNLNIQNYPVHCFYVESCTNLLITNINIDNSAGNAPNAISGGLAAAHNTDGFDISGCTNVVLSNSNVNNQDDCVAITSGNYITVSGMYCNGSHGLSIGSVGGKSNNNVTNILFTDSTVANSQNAARIKSNYNTTGFISNVTYSNIAVIDVSVYGLDIQQDYLNGGPTGIPSNGVIITDINIINVTGTAVGGAQDYYILCGSGSCSDFTFTNVNIVGGTIADSCNYPPSGCPGGSGGSAATSTTLGTSTSSTVASTIQSSSTSKSSSAPTTNASSSAPTTTAVSPYARTSPPAGAVVVDATGATAGSYLTVQAGVNALSLTSTTPQNLFIYPGTYTEQVYIPALKSNLTVQGYTLDGSSYEGNTATVTYNLALLDTTSDDLTATVRQWNPNTKFYNLNIANTFGHVSTNGQNLALSAHTTNQGYYGVQLWGYQDTLLSNTGNQLYSKSLIVGAIDFIFGQTATAWFDQVDIRTIATGCVTASGRASASNPSWYVINNSTVAGINSSIAPGINYLGRPWEQFARVVFQDTEISDVIAPAGWRPWSTAVNGTTNTENITFAEYDNYGPGSVLEEGPRASFSEQLSQPIAIETVLGSGWTGEWWVDQAYMV